ncbi:MAG: glycosyltransferase family 9 protein [Candidatus Anstonellales archaeon]
MVISPCATRKTKMLLVQQYNYLLKSLLDKLDQKYFLILTGTNNDSNFITNITAGIKSERLKSLVGKVSLKELAYLLSISNLVITPDSGPAYISEAVGAKTVVFFTSTTPDKYGPFSDNVRLFYNPVFCSPCYKDKCKNYTCLKNFEIDELIKISLNFLKE